MRKSDAISKKDQQQHEERMKWLDNQHEEKTKKMDEEIAETKRQTKLIDEQKAKIQEKAEFWRSIYMNDWRRSKNKFSDQVKEK